jgi:hypothetical protein
MSDPSDLAMVDVDFERESQAAGMSRGANPRTMKFGAPKFAEAIEIIPESQWESVIEQLGSNTLDRLTDHTHDQNGDVSCTSNATCFAHETLQSLQHGKDRIVILSPMSLYNRVGSRNSGSAVDDNLDEMVRRGILPLDNDANKARFTHTMRHNGYGSCPSGWESTAALFRGAEWFEIENSASFITALLKGFPVVYGRQGHAICAIRAVIRDGRVYAKYKNSWGEWGDKGYGYDSLSMVRQGADWAFALRAIVSPPELLA